jgi:hypothetical protein
MKVSKIGSSTDNRWEIEKIQREVNALCTQRINGTPQFEDGAITSEDLYYKLIPEFMMEAITTFREHGYGGAFNYEHAALISVTTMARQLRLSFQSPCPAVSGYNRYDLGRNSNVRRVVLPETHGMHSAICKFVEMASAVDEEVRITQRFLQDVTMHNGSSWEKCVTVGQLFRVWPELQPLLSTTAQDHLAGMVRKSRLPSHLKHEAETEVFQQRREIATRTVTLGAVAGASKPAPTIWVSLSSE